MSGAVDAPLVVAERWLFQTSAGRPLDPPPSLGPPSERAFGDFLEQRQAGHLANAFATWKKLARPPRSYFEKTLLAELASALDDPGLLPFLDSLENEGDRELLRGLRAARRGDPEGAASALERGFLLLREDPWVRLPIASAAIDAAVNLATLTKPLATRMFAALDAPFAAEARRSARLVGRARVGHAIDPEHCARAMHDLEPAPYLEAIMQLRLDCYASVDDPLTSAAREDVARLTAWQGTFAGELKLDPGAPGTPFDPAQGPSHPRSGKDGGTPDPVVVGPEGGASVYDGGRGVGSDAAGPR